MKTLTPTLINAISPTKDFSPLLSVENKRIITDYITHWAKTNPNSTAVIDHGVSYSYHELNSIANQIANGLINKLGKKEEPVALLFGKEALAIFSILGILKAGKAYSGIDPQSPIPYLRLICEELKPGAIITSKTYQTIAEEITPDTAKVIIIDNWLNNFPTEAPEVNITFDMLACIFFTSGSTGRSKGVILDHNGLWHRNLHNINSYKYCQSDRTCMPFPVGLNWSATPLFGTLINGGTLILYDYVDKSIGEIEQWFVENKITNAPVPAGFMKKFLAGIEETKLFSNSKLRFISVGSDEFTLNDVRLYQKKFPKEIVLVYLFSSSEAGNMFRTFYTTSSSLPERDLFFEVPVPEVDVFILDEQRKSVQPNTPGEIAVRSQGNMVGYWSKNGIDTSRLIDDPEIPGGKILLTGDMGFLNEHNHLKFLGRQDKQLKIRGFRVDLSIIDAILRKSPSVKDVAIVADKRKNGDVKILAYLILKDGLQASTQDIKDFAINELPEYMLPSSFMIVDQFPYSASGKVNTFLLPKPKKERTHLSSVFVPPQSTTELTIASIWREVLDLDEIGVQDNFFELGGDSLSVLEMILLVENSLSKTIPQSFFKTPTISHLISLLTDDSNLHALAPSEFQVESFRQKGISKSPDQKFSRKKKFSLKKMFSGKYSATNFYHFLDGLIARIIINLSYEQAKRWMVNWSKSNLVRTLFYRTRFNLFQQWLTSIQADTTNIEEKFQLSTITNLNYGLIYYIDKKNHNHAKKDILEKVDQLSKSPWPFWSSFGNILASYSQDDINQLFPVSGLEILTNALNEKNGVILLSFHGFSPPLRLIPLSVRLGINIFTISYRISFSQSEYHATPKDAHEYIGSTLNAEIALHGQRILSGGGIINIIGDSFDPYGKPYQIDVGGRAYRVKNGFADMAFNSNAKIIPYFGYCLPDGSLQTVILPPLQSSLADRNAKNDDLMNQYARFINFVWHNYPQAVRWGKIQNYFHMPRF